jgi:hypothetical protein
MQGCHAACFARPNSNAPPLRVIERRSHEPTPPPVPQSLNTNMAHFVRKCRCAPQSRFLLLDVSAARGAVVRATLREAFSGFVNVRWYSSALLAFHVAPRLSSWAPGRLPRSIRASSPAALSLPARASGVSSFPTLVSQSNLSSFPTFLARAGQHRGNYSASRKTYSMYR